MLYFLESLFAGALNGSSPEASAADATAERASHHAPRSAAAAAPGMSASGGEAAAPRGNNRNSSSRSRSNNNNNNNAPNFPPFFDFLHEAFGVATSSSSSSAATGAAFDAAATAASSFTAAVDPYAASFASSYNADQQRRGPPPASRKVVQQLPIIAVSPEDLIEVVNRQCSICLECNELQQHCVRLPCAHIFHQHCIHPWLFQHCNSCPVCRYELPTDNVNFEIGRIQRMKSRKPRFARHELDRYTMAQLKQLAPPTSSSSLCFRGDRNDWIHYLVQSHCIEIIPSPPPVVYSYTTLQSMSISQLKHTMEDAGVFYRKEDVVEKSDLLTIFINSGRLQMVPDTTVSGGGVEEEREHDEGDDDNNNDTKPRAMPMASGITTTTTEQREEGRTVILMEEDLSYRGPTESGRHDGEMDANDDDGESVEDVTPFDHQEDHPPVGGGDDDDEILECPDEPRMDEATTMQNGVPEITNNGIVVVSVEDELEGDGNVAEMAQGAVNESTIMAEEESDASDRKRQRDSPLKSFYLDLGAEQDARSLASLSVAEQHDSRQTSETEYSKATSEVADRPAGLTISQLSVLAREMSVDISDCLERQEILDRLGAHDRSCCTGPSPSEGELIHTTALLCLDRWGVSELRALTGLVGVDVSHCSDRHEMIGELQAVSVIRPHAGQYLRALAPLAGLSVGQLRAVARDWKVDISDCLEKGDMIRRIVSVGPSTSRFA